MKIFPPDSLLTRYSRGHFRVNFGFLVKHVPLEKSAKVPVHGNNRRKDDDPQHRASGGVKKYLPIDPGGSSRPHQVTPGRAQLRYRPKLDSRKRATEV